MNKVSLDALFNPLPPPVRNTNAGEAGCPAEEACMSTCANSNNPSPAAVTNPHVTGPPPPIYGAVFS